MEGESTVILFPTLLSEMAKRKVSKKQMAQVAGISDKALYNKLNGRAPFTWNEICAIRQFFFPDMSSDELFAMSE